MSSKIKILPRVYFTPEEWDRISNVHLGVNGCIITNRSLLNNKRLHSYVDDATMGALDNYAKYNNLEIYIKPLENDLFHDLAVSGYQKGSVNSSFKFPIKLNEGRHSFSDFITELHQKITNAVSNPKKSETGFSELA